MAYHWTSCETLVVEGWEVVRQSFLWRGDVGGSRDSNHLAVLRFGVASALWLTCGDSPVRWRQPRMTGSY